MMLRFCKIIMAGSLLFALTINASAEGPADVAKAKSNLWPGRISSRRAFDAASRAEILLFLSVYKDMFATEIKPADLGVKTINTESFKQWQEQFKSEWLTTFRAAMKTCSNQNEFGCAFKDNSFDKLLDYATQFTASLPDKYHAWKRMSQSFYLTYLKEQARLAALFPHPTSEILPLTHSEIIGNDFKDGEFLLTMDDGPSEDNGTSRYTDLLRKNNISAFFFVLGDGVDAKLKTTSPESLRTMYAGQCLASHGYQHFSHQTQQDWKESIDKTSALVKKIRGYDAPVQFRPPYGQYHADLVKYIDNQYAHVFLWNIDSQDWQKNLLPEEVSVRVHKLMLLWRKGIILFHDVHNKAYTAIPDAVEMANHAHLRWIQCSSWL